MPRTGNFRFSGRCVHLTYKTWLTDEQVAAVALKPGKEVEQFSYCHENGHGDTAYLHSHVLIKWTEKVETSDTRYFDIGEIHPHIKTVDLRYKTQFENVMNYHKKEGVFCKQVPEWNPDEEAPNILQTSIPYAETMTMLDFAVERNGTWKDIMGMEKFHKLVQRRKRTKAIKEFVPDDFRFPKPDNLRVMFIYGPKGSGKTEWAKTWFENPLVVRTIDELKAFEENFHDGIIFDDARFGELPEDTVQSLVEWDNHAQLHARYENAFIPARTQKVFTSNYPPETVFGPQNWFSEAGQVRCRVTEILEVTKCLFKPEIVIERGLNINGRAEPKRTKLD